MKSLLVLGVVLLSMGAVMQGATALWSLRERSNDAFDYDVQQRRWYARVLLVLGATLGAAYSFLLLIVGLLLQLLVALDGVIPLPRL